MKKKEKIQTEIDKYHQLLKQAEKDYYINYKFSDLGLEVELYSDKKITFKDIIPKEIDDKTIKEHYEKLANFIIDNT